MKKGNLSKALRDLILHDIAEHGARRGHKHYGRLLYPNEPEAVATRRARQLYNLRVKEDLPCTVQPPEDGPTLDEYMDLAQHGQDIQSRLSPLYRELEIFVQCSEPLALVFSSDWHLGSLGTDYARWARDVQFFIDTPLLRLLTLGDLIENCASFKNARSILSQVLSPEQQVDCLEKVVEKVAPKMLAAGWGNHDAGRDERAVGHSFVRQIFRKHQVPYFAGVGIVRLLVGETRESAQPYLLLANHTPRGRSMYNRLHGAQRLRREVCPQADIVATAHTHAPAAMTETSAGRDIHYVQLGTYNVNAEYAIKAYGSSGAVSAPTFLLWPDQRRIERFGSAENAVIFRRGLRDDG